MQASNPDGLIGETPDCGERLEPATMQRILLPKETTVVTSLSDFGLPKQSEQSGARKEW